MGQESASSCKEKSVVIRIPGNPHRNHLTCMGRETTLYIYIQIYTQRSTFFPKDFRFPHFPIEISKDFLHIPQTTLQPIRFDPTSMLITQEGIDAKDLSRAESLRVRHPLHWC